MGILKTICYNCGVEHDQASGSNVSDYCLVCKKKKVVEKTRKRVTCLKCGSRQKDTIEKCSKCGHFIKGLSALRGLPGVEKVAKNYVLMTTPYGRHYRTSEGFLSDQDTGQRFCMSLSNHHNHYMEALQVYAMSEMSIERFLVNRERHYNNPLHGAALEQAAKKRIKERREKLNER